MIWPFKHKRQAEQRDARVMALEEKARNGEITLVHSILELDRKRHTLDQLTAEALKDLGRPHRA